MGAGTLRAKHGKTKLVRSRKAAQTKKKVNNRKPSKRSEKDRNKQQRLLYSGDARQDHRDRKVVERTITDEDAYAVLCKDHVTKIS